MSGARTVRCVRCDSVYDIRSQSAACPHGVIAPFELGPTVMIERGALKAPEFINARMHRSDLRALMYAVFAAPMAADGEPLTPEGVASIERVVESILESVDETAVQPVPEQDIVGFIHNQHAADACDTLDAEIFSGDAFHNGQALTRLLEYLERWKREALNIQASLTETRE